MQNKKECLAAPKTSVNPCITSNYNCYECKYWAYKEIEINETTNWDMIFVASGLGVFIGGIIALIIFTW